MIFCNGENKGVHILNLILGVYKRQGLQVGKGLSYLMQ